MHIFWTFSSSLFILLKQGSQKYGLLGKKSLLIFSCLLHELFFFILPNLWKMMHLLQMIFSVIEFAMKVQHSDSDSILKQNTPAQKRSTSQNIKHSNLPNVSQCKNTFLFLLHTPVGASDPRQLGSFGNERRKERHFSFLPVQEELLEIGIERAAC